MTPGRISMIPVCHQDSLRVASCSSSLSLISSPSDFPRAAEALAELGGHFHHQVSMSLSLRSFEPGIKPTDQQCPDQATVGAEHRGGDTADVGIALPSAQAPALSA